MNGIWKYKMLLALKVVKGIHILILMRKIYITSTRNAKDLQNVLSYLLGEVANPFHNNNLTTQLPTF